MKFTALHCENVRIHVERLYDRLHPQFPEFHNLPEDVEGQVTNPMSEFYAKFPIAFASKMYPLDTFFVLKNVNPKGVLLNDPLGPAAADFVQCATKVFDMLREMITNVESTGLSEENKILLALLDKKIGEAANVHDYFTIWRDLICPSSNPTCRELLKAFILRGCSYPEFNRILGRLIIYRPYFFLEVFPNSSIEMVGYKQIIMCTQLFNLPSSMLMGNQQYQNDADLSVIDFVYDLLIAFRVPKEKISRLLDAAELFLRKSKMLNETNPNDETSNVDDNDPYRELTEMLKNKWTDEDGVVDETAEADSMLGSENLFAVLMSTISSLESDGTLDMGAIQERFEEMKKSKGKREVRRIISMASGETTDSKVIHKLIEPTVVKRLLKPNQMRREMMDALSVALDRNLPQIKAAVASKFPYLETLLDTLSNVKTKGAKKPQQGTKLKLQMRPAGNGAEEEK